MKSAFARWFAVALVALLLVPAMAVADDPTCTPTGYIRDGINLTALLINPEGTVSGTVDATGCDIGLYYDGDTVGMVDGAEVFGAKYFGIINRGTDVTVRNSSIHDIGDTPLSGAQHGVAISMTMGPDGSTLPVGVVENNQIFKYQKNGMALSYGTFQVTNNTVKGEGHISYTAQNGIQIGFGATGTVANNTVSGNWYEPATWSSTGILVYQGKNVRVINNKLTDNLVGIYLFEGTGAKLISNKIAGVGSDAEGDWSIFIEESDAKQHANKVAPAE